jgi:hypothetical protein
MKVNKKFSPEQNVSTTFGFGASEAFVGWGISAFTRVFDVLWARARLCRAAPTRIQCGVWARLAQKRSPIARRRRA